MRTLIFAVLVLAAACSQPGIVRTGPIPTEDVAPKYTRFLPGVELTVKNNYAPCLDIRASTGHAVSCLTLGEEASLNMNVYPGGPEKIVVTVTGRTESNGYLGADEKTFSPRNETVAKIWRVDRLRPPRRIRTGR